MGKPSIVVAEDSPAFLQKLISLLEVDFNIVATATDGKSASDIIRRYKPDLVVLELGLPVLNGIEVSREVTKHAPPLVICSRETGRSLRIRFQNACRKRPNVQLFRASLVRAGRMTRSYFTRPRSLGFGKQMHFLLRNDKFRDPTMEADQDLGKYPNVWAINIFKSPKMDGDLTGEVTQVFRTT